MHEWKRFQGPRKALTIMNDFAIDDMIIFSDHAVISFSLSINHVNLASISRNDKMSRMKWKESRKE